MPYHWPMVNKQTVLTFALVLYAQPQISFYQINVLDQSSCRNYIKFHSWFLPSPSFKILQMTWPLTKRMKLRITTTMLWIGEDVSEAFLQPRIDTMTNLLRLNSYFICHHYSFIYLSSAGCYDAFRMCSRFRKLRGKCDKIVRKKAFAMRFCRRSCQLC